MKLSRFIVGAAVVVCFLLSLFGSIPPATAAPVYYPDGDYWIDNNTIFINGSIGYLGLYPHTRSSSGWVYTALNTSTYTGDIDICAGFDSDIATLRTPQLYQPHIEEYTVYHTQFFPFVSKIEVYNEDIFDYGESYNTYQRQITYISEDYGERTVNVSFDSFYQDDNNYTIQWYTEHERKTTWDKMPGTIETISYDFQDKNKWHYIKNLPVVAGNIYIMRVWVEIPIVFAPDRIQFKYLFATKPSHLSIEEAIASDNLYYIDPWFDSNWGYRKQVIVDHVNASGETLLNYGAYINVSKEIEMQADYDDVIFVNDTTDILMDYELENYTVDYAIYWVNITHLTVPNQTFWMYYDNAGATSQEDPEGVWDVNTIMVHHFNDLNDSTRYNNDGTNFGTEYANTWLLDGERVFGIEATDYIDVGTDESLNITGDLTIITWMNSVKDRDKYHPFLSKGGVFEDDTNYDFGLRLETIYLHWKNGASLYGGAQPTIGIHDGVWNQVYGIRDSVFNASIYNNSVFAGSDGENEIATNANWSAKIGMWSGVGTSSRNYEGSLAELRLYNRTLSADEINQSYELVINQSTHVTYGANESGAPCNDSMPPAPITPTNTNGTTWVNQSWTVGSDNPNITDNYIYTVNGSSNQTTTNTYVNTTGLPCGGVWVNITVWAQNTTCNTSVNITSITDNFYLFEGCPTPTPTPTPTATPTPPQIGNLTITRGETWINITRNNTLQNVTLWIDGINNGLWNLSVYILSGLEPNEEHYFYISYDLGGNTTYAEDITTRTLKTSMHNNFLYLFFAIIGLLYIGMHLRLFLFIAFILSIYGTVTSLSQTNESWIMLAFALIAVISAYYISGFARSKE